MTKDYVHLELEREIESISGSYTPLKELRIKINGRDILCVIGMAVVDTACCGAGNFIYATVPGYVVDWKEREDGSGQSVSRVEPVADETVRHEVAQTIGKNESINTYNVNFW